MVKFSPNLHMLSSPFSQLTSSFYFYDTHTSIFPQRKKCKKKFWFGWPGPEGRRWFLISWYSSISIATIDKNITHLPLAVSFSNWSLEPQHSGNRHGKYVGCFGWWVRITYEWLASFANNLCPLVGNKCSKDMYFREYTFLFQMKLAYLVHCKPKIRNVQERTVFVNKGTTKITNIVGATKAKFFTQMVADMKDFLKISVQ